MSGALSRPLRRAATLAANARDAGRRAAPVGADGYLDAPVSESAETSGPLEEMDPIALDPELAEDDGVAPGLQASGAKVPPAPADFKVPEPGRDEAQELIELFRPLIEDDE